MFYVNGGLLRKAQKNVYVNRASLHKHSGFCVNPFSAGTYRIFLYGICLRKAALAWKRQGYALGLQFDLSVANAVQILTRTPGSCYQFTGSQIF